MRHILCAGVWLVVCNLSVLVFSVSVFAQDAPKAEIFAGFSYGNYELIPGTSSFSNPDETISGSSSARLGLFGWNGSVAVNVNRWFSLATDFSGLYSGSSASTTTTETLTCGPGCTQTITIVNVASHAKVHNFLFGPQFSYPAGKVRPFAHFLLGLERLDFTRSENVSGTGVGFITIVPLPFPAGDNEFAVAIGGGVDYSIKHNLAWRLESDYLTGQGTDQNHVRVSTGLVWRLGN
ncbi:MAG TPA: outer membrane beta-barrel protein [Terriglobales bacterium]|nr:outer membrane beta-barrel protein [Terriglobales bacterium]